MALNKLDVIEGARVWLGVGLLSFISVWRIMAHRVLYPNKPSDS
jgi:hypothetical protein